MHAPGVPVLAYLASSHNNIVSLMNQSNPNPPSGIIYNSLLTIKSIQALRQHNQPKPQIPDPSLLLPLQESPHSQIQRPLAQHILPIPQ